MPTVNKQSGEKKKKKIYRWIYQEKHGINCSKRWKTVDTFIWCFTISLLRMNLVSATNVGKYLYHKTDLEDHSEIVLLHLCSPCLSWTRFSLNDAPSTSGPANQSYVIFTEVHHQILEATPAVGVSELGSEQTPQGTCQGTVLCLSWVIFRSQKKPSFSFLSMG